MDHRLRRNLGAHYTSVKNILKLIKPLFLDDLWDEFRRVKGNVNRLFEFHKKLATLRFLDPACGCGNFLVISYRELRLLELEILKAALASHQKFVDVFNLVQLDVDQFYGIELEEFPAQIAQVALWLMDHQMNLAVSEEFGMYFARLPLRKSPTVVHGNALQLDWADIVVPEKLSYLLGNPPFVGKQYQTAEQKADLEPLFSGLEGSGVLDYVAGWYAKAAHYIGGTPIRCALVSTNSIIQGEQAGVLWPELLRRGIHIHFAHRTFQWSNEARGVAAVHCVIIGFGLDDPPRKTLFTYDDPKGEPHPVTAANINPYLVDAPDVVLENRRNRSAVCPNWSLAACQTTVVICCSTTPKGKRCCARHLQRPKVSALGIGTLAFRPFAWQGISELQQLELLGRITVGKVDMYARPDANSQIVGVLYEDQVIPWIREVVGTMPGRINQRWVETPYGYMWGGNLQPVRNLPNSPVSTPPNTSLGPGMWVEVTVPYVDLVLDNPPSRAPWLKYRESINLPARFVYSQVVWVDQVRTETDGRVWYRLNEGFGSGDLFWGPAEAFRPPRMILTAPNASVGNPN